MSAEAANAVAERADALLAILGAWCKAKRGYNSPESTGITVSMIEAAADDLQAALINLPGYKEPKP